MLVPLLSQTACSTASTAIESTPQQMCRSLLPIYPSRQDKLTEGTAKQIAESNAANEVWCGSRPPVKETTKVASHG